MSRPSYLAGKGKELRIQKTQTYTTQGLTITCFCKYRSFISSSWGVHTVSCVKLPSSTVWWRQRYFGWKSTDFTGRGKSISSCVTSRGQHWWGTGTVNRKSTKVSYYLFWILKEVYCPIHRCMSIIKEQTVHTFILAFSAPFVCMVLLHFLIFFLWAHFGSWRHLKKAHFIADKHSSQFATVQLEAVRIDLLIC